jgi:hypothetical protein
VGQPLYQFQSPNHVIVLLLQCQHIHWQDDIFPEFHMSRDFKKSQGTTLSPTLGLLLLFLIKVSVASIFGFLIAAVS